MDRRYRRPASVLRPRCREQIELPVDGGVLSGLDFGGRGSTGVLLVYGSSHNAAAWADVASMLAGH
jgi:hypothetical protein